MPAYTAPVDDMLFVLGDLLGAEATLAGLGGEEVPLSLMGEVLSEAGRFCEKIAQPINRSGDEEGCVLENGVVRTPRGFPEAYAAFVEAGWPGLSHAPEHGGQGLPRVLQVLFDEMLSSANFSFGLFPGLTRGAVEAIERHATDELKALYLPPMVEGRWMGAMALTEAQAGTDLGLLRTRAAPDEDGGYRLTGSKIFISAGDHDLAENIIHLVLARLPDAPAGVKGISLFLVPKVLPDAAGGLGARNGVTAGSIEHKMGLKASPTCVMHFDDAKGWLVGAPNQGLRAMFTMMNAERLFVGIQGLGIAEAAYQGASAYAKDRLQGRAPGAPAGEAQSILVHPDVRKMLLTIRAFTESGRALAAWTALEMEKAARHPDATERARAESMVALLTPVIKAAFTDLGFEAAVLGQQVFGGHGYVREWGMEQLVRDARIAQIYEGTNGVQAMDLVGRKIFQDDGALPHAFFAEIRATLAAGGAPEINAPLAEALNRLEAATESLKARATDNPAETGAAATDYLRFFALVALGWMWVRMAQLQGGYHHAEKQALAHFFMTRILPQSLALDQALRAGAAPLMALEESAF
jgi:alkylation response protein AidB-like acyl-CoA dehydrogenase